MPALFGLLAKLRRRAPVFRRRRLPVFIKTAGGCRTAECAWRDAGSPHWCRLGLWCPCGPGRCVRGLTGVALSGEERNPGLGCCGRRLSCCGPAPGVGELGKGGPPGVSRGELGQVLRGEGDLQMAPAPSSRDPECCPHHPHPCPAPYRARVNVSLAPPHPDPNPPPPPPCARHPGLSFSPCFLWNFR